MYSLRNAPFDPCAFSLSWSLPSASRLPSLLPTAVVEILPVNPSLVKQRQRNAPFPVARVQGREPQTTSVDHSLTAHPRVSFRAQSSRISAQTTSGAVTMARITRELWGTPRLVSSRRSQPRRLSTPLQLHLSEGRSGSLWRVERIFTALLRLDLLLAKPARQTQGLAMPALMSTRVVSNSSKNVVRISRRICLWMTVAVRFLPCSWSADLFIKLSTGHANPYHHHYDLACDYDKTASGHSALTGVALDGRGIYGLYEKTGAVPTDLDACGGHCKSPLIWYTVLINSIDGPVPAHTVGGVTYSAASNVYHYHTQSSAPFTLGCFGPVKSLAECKSLYPSTCGSGFTTFTTTKGTVSPLSYFIKGFNELVLQLRYWLPLLQEWNRNL